MTTLIDVLREEHRNIEKLLGVLEQELSVFDHRERPDFDTLRAIIDYFAEYPARCHHPKEDMMVEILKARDPVLMARSTTSATMAVNTQSMMDRSQYRISNQKKCNMPRS